MLWGRKMVEKMYIRPIKTNEEFKVSGMIKDTFNAFINDEFYSENGIKNFLRYIDAHNISYRLKNNHIMLVAEDNKIVKGAIEIRDLNHISLLFVGKQYINEGIGTELLSYAISVCRENNKELESITVNATPQSVNLYKRLNFQPIKSQQVVNGIVFVPMELKN